MTHTRLKILGLSGSRGDDFYNVASSFGNQEKNKTILLCSTDMRITLGNL